MPLLLIPLAKVLSGWGLSLTFTGGSGAVLGAGAIGGWSVTTVGGTILMSATTAYTTLATVGTTGLVTALAVFGG